MCISTWISPFKLSEVYVRHMTLQSSNSSIFQSSKLLKLIVHFLEMKTLSDLCLHFSAPQSSTMQHSWYFTGKIQCMKSLHSKLSTQHASEIRGFAFSKIFCRCRLESLWWITGRSFSNVSICTETCKSDPKFNIMGCRISIQIQTFEQNQQHILNRYLFKYALPEVPIA